MIIGVGLDVVDTDRFAAALARTPGLAGRLFTPAERVLPDGSPRALLSLAARFAAKEALVKALGVPHGLLWHDAEVVTGERGRPALATRGTVAAAVAAAGIASLHLSLSHETGLAAAIVVAES